jgi:Putative phage tail protein
MLERVKETYQELMERKRAELEASLEQGQVGEPFSATAFFISLAVSASVSAASYFISKAFQPKVPRQQTGKMQGSLQLQNSEQGIFIPEIYGAGPATSSASSIAITYQNVVNASTPGGGAITKNAGGSGSWNAHATTTAQITVGLDGCIRFTAGAGPCLVGFSTVANPTATSDVLFGILLNITSYPGLVTANAIQPVTTGTQSPDVGQWATGDLMQVEIRDNKFRAYKGAVELFNLDAPTPSYPLWPCVFMYNIGSGVSALTIINNGTLGDSPNAGRGGIKVPAIIVWTSGIRKNISTTTQQTGGGKGGGHSQTVENITYDIDLGLMFGRGSNNLLRLYGNADILIDQFAQTANPSGVYDPGVGGDSTYDPAAPPNPKTAYTLSTDRTDGDISFDVDSVGTGTIHGGGTSFAIYQGNATQQPDPVIEADVDAKYGTGSTPAFHNHSLVRLSTLSLSRWGGIVPNITAVWEHTTLKTLDTIYGSFCERVGVLAANSDYDFSGLSAISCRGLLITGRPFAPAEVIDDPNIKLAYNYFVTEAEGQIKGFAEGSEPSVTIPDTEIGWLEGDTDLPDVLSEVDSMLAAEITLPREIHVKSLDPDNDWESNTQNAIRQVTDGQSVELLEIQIAQLSDERRATAQRALYQRYVAGTTHKFTLSWTYLYLYPGYKVIITRAEGFTHTLRLTSITGGIGVLECEGVALEPEAFNQPANGVFPPGYIPPQPVPAMTIVMLLDTPLLRDGDLTNNDGVGQYVVGVPRTGIDQTWQGFALYQFKNNSWNVLANSSIPGTVGTVVSVSLLSIDPTTVDNVGRIVVDLYGASILSSVTEADIIGGANLAIAGEMVFNFATATQIAGSPNRWELSKLLNGQKQTDEFIASVAAGNRFVLVDGAVTFFPMDIADINTSMDYRAVSSGQSLDDAATVSEVWSARSLKADAVSDVRLSQDGSADWLIEFTGHAKVSEEPAQFALEIWVDATRDNPANIKRVLPVTRGTAQAALLIGVTPPSHTIGGGTKPYTIIASTWTGHNNVYAIIDAPVTASTLQIFGSAFMRLDFTLNSTNGVTPTLTGSSSFGFIEDGTSTAISFNSTIAPCYLVTSQGAGSTVDVAVKSYGSTVVTLNYPYADLWAGLRFSLLIVGNEYRVYRDYAFGKTPAAVIAAPSGGPTFPLRGIFNLVSSSFSDVSSVGIGIATGTQLGTIYAAREQIADFGSSPAILHARIYQKGIPPRPDGWPADFDAQTIGGFVLLETADHLLLETGDKLLKE